MPDHSTFQEAKERAAYQGTLAAIDIRESVTLDLRGQLHIHTRARNYRPETVPATAAMIIGLLGVIIVNLIAFDLLPPDLIGGSGMIWFIVGMGLMGAALFPLMKLLYRTERFTLTSPIDHQTIHTLTQLKGQNAQVTRDLLDIAYASRKHSQAIGELETAQQRIELAGPTEALASEVARASSAADEALGERSESLGRLIEFASAREHGVSAK